MYTSDRNRNTGNTIEPSVTQTATIQSTELFAGRNEIQIRHESELYRLRVTKNGKLILTK